MNEVHKILSHLAPPIRLTIWLSDVFAAKQAKGEPVPKEYEEWLERWAKIRSAEASEIDDVTPETWDRVAELVP